MFVVSAGLSVMLSAVNVHLRDTQHFFELALIAWFWMTPIVYDYELAAPKLHHGWDKVLYLANPLLGIVLAFQRVLYNQLDTSSVDPHSHKRVITHLLPHWTFGTYAGLELLGLVFGVVLLVVALYVFGRLEGSIAEEL
jgi:ABC-2 type transport system permease protein